VEKIHEDDYIGPTKVFALADIVGPFSMTSS